MSNYYPFCFDSYLPKKKMGFGGRKSTMFGSGGNKLTNKPQNLNNKYQTSNNGVGASTIANRRAKNRLATICRMDPNGQCFKGFDNLCPPNGTYKYTI